MQNGQISWTGLIWKALSLKNAPLRFAWLLLLTLLSLLMFFIIVAKKKNGEGTCTDISLNSLTVLTVVLITLFSFYAYSSVRSLLHWTNVFQSFIREIWRAFFVLFRLKRGAIHFSGSNSMESAGVDQQVKVPMLNTVYPRDAPRRLHMWERITPTSFTCLLKVSTY